MQTNSSSGYNLRIKIWGARGSLPSPLTPDALEAHIRLLLTDLTERGLGKEKDLEKLLAQLPRNRFGGYGGNTPCIEVRSPAHQIIIDGGSGIRPLGYDLMNGPCGKGQGEVHILFTHFHWDHLIGLPFFTPIFIPGNKIHVYAVQPDLPAVFKTIFQKPFFPVPLDRLGSKIEYHQLAPHQPFQMGDIQVTPYQLDHPDPCWGYRFEKGGKVFSHCVDTECTRVSREQLGPDAALYKGVDLMIFDAQYTLMETIEKVNWGHAAASLGLDIAMRESIKRVLFMHHDPASSNEKIAQAEAQARRYYDNQIKSAKRSGVHVQEVDWAFAYEGQIVDL
ncbi:MAG: MBL fold metallo-hydrolase [Bdellovibrionota bacterium]